MNELAAWLSNALLRTTIALSVAFALASVLLWLTSSRSPSVCRVIWIIVLLQGWMFGRYAVDIPWRQVQPFQAHVAGGDPLLEGAMPPALGPGRQPSTAARGIRPIEQTLVNEQAPQHASWTWHVILVLAWLIGGLVIALRWAAGYWQFVRNVPLGEPASADDERAWRRLLAERNVAEAIPLRMTENLGPMLCRVPGGYRLLMPRSFWQELSTEGRLAVLRHELAHYERGDVWKSLVARLLVLPHWFNPLAWRALRNFEEAAEWACDDAVRRESPENAPLYGRILLALGAAQAPRTILNTAARGRGLALRIRRVAAPDLPDDSRMKKACLVGAGLALLLAGGLQLKLVAQDTAGRANARLHDQAAEAMLTAAKNAMMATKAGYDAGTVVMPDVYVWSRRWLEAEQKLARNQQDQLAALRSHWQRMHQLHRKVGALYFAGSRGGEVEKYHATAFYLAEAELWLADAGGDVPERVPAAAPRR